MGILMLSITKLQTLSNHGLHCIGKHDGDSDVEHSVVPRGALSPTGLFTFLALCIKPNASFQAYLLCNCDRKEP